MSIESKQYPTKQLPSGEVIRIFTPQDLIKDTSLSPFNISKAEREYFNAQGYTRYQHYRRNNDYRGQGATGKETTLKLKSPFRYVISKLFNI